MFFDTHCHLADAPLADDFQAVLTRAQENGVTGFLNMADSLESAEAAIAQVRAARALDVGIWATAGVHPTKASAWDAGMLWRLREMASYPIVHAIGEIGLDYVYDEYHPTSPCTTREVQEKALRDQLALALELKLPVVLHNREADDAILDIVAQYEGLTGVFHCFEASLEAARCALNLGFYLGFTGLVTFKNADSVREVARYCPLDRLLIETDSPYLAPVPHRGKTNEPAYLPRVAAAIAELHCVSLQTVADATTTNAFTLFHLSSETIIRSTP